MTNLVVVIICSIPRCQLAHVLLTRRRVVRVCEMSSATGSLSIALWYMRYSVAVRWSNCVRWCETCWRWYCALDCSYAMVSTPYIMACARTSFGRMPSVFGANHSRELSGMFWLRELLRRNGNGFVLLQVGWGLYRNNIGQRWYRWDNGQILCRLVRFRDQYHWSMPSGNVPVQQECDPVLLSLYLSC